MPNVVFFDFAGVLDIKNSHEVHDRDLHSKVLKQVDTDKAFMLLSFVKESLAVSGSKFACISTLEQYGANIVVALSHALSKSENEEHRQLGRYFDRGTTPDKELFLNHSDSKNETIARYMSRHPEMTPITFEDSDPIDEKFGLVRVGSSSRLQQKNIDLARTMLSKD